jgi:hypothetical protein
MMPVTVTRRRLAESEPQAEPDSEARLGVMMLEARGPARAPGRIAGPARLVRIVTTVT